MAVHYKFNAAREFDTLPVDGLHISLADLKDAITHHKRLGKGDVCDLQVTNAETKQVYTDEKALIPKNSSLIIARVPIDPSQRKFGDLSRHDKELLLSNPEYRMNTEGSEEAEFLRRKLEEIPDLTKFAGSEGDKISAMIAQSTIDYHPSRYLKLRNTVMSGKVPPFYKCYKCHQGGHWVSDCPLNNQDLRKCSGIPSRFLLEVDDPKAPGAMITPQGRYVVFRQNTELVDNSQDKIPRIGAVEAPKELVCLLCKEMMQDAVLVPCCANAFCDECIRNHLLDSDNDECPSCFKTDVGPDTLIPNRYLRLKIQFFARHYVNQLTVPGENGRSDSQASDIQIMSQPGTPSSPYETHVKAGIESPVGSQTSTTEVSPKEEIHGLEVVSESDNLDTASVSSKERKKLKKKKKKEAKEAGKEKKHKKKDKEKKKKKDKKHEKSPSPSESKPESSPLSQSNSHHDILMNEAIGLPYVARPPLPHPVMMVRPVQMMPMHPRFPGPVPRLRLMHPQQAAHFAHMRIHHGVPVPIGHMRYPAVRPPPEPVEDPLETFNRYLELKDERKRRNRSSSRSPPTYHSPSRGRVKYNRSYSRSRSRSPSRRGWSPSRSRRESPRSRRRHSPSPSSGGKHRYRSRSRTPSRISPSGHFAEPSGEYGHHRVSSSVNSPYRSHEKSKDSYKHSSRHGSSQHHSHKDTSEDSGDKYSSERHNYKNSKGHGGYCSERSYSRNSSPHRPYEKEDLRRRIEERKMADEKRSQKPEESRKDHRSSRAEEEKPKRSSRSDSKRHRSTEPESRERRRDKSSPVESSKEKRRSERHNDDEKGVKSSPKKSRLPDEDKRAVSKEKEGSSHEDTKEKTESKTNVETDTTEPENEKKKHDKKKKKKEKRRASQASQGSTEEAVNDLKKQKKKEKKMLKLEANATGAKGKIKKKSKVESTTDAPENEEDELLKPFLPALSKWEREENENTSNEKETEQVNLKTSEAPAVTSDVLKRAENALFSKAFPVSRTLVPRKVEKKMKANETKSSISVSEREMQEAREAKRKGPSIQITISSKTESQIGKPKSTSSSGEPNPKDEKEKIEEKPNKLPSSLEIKPSESNDSHTEAKQKSLPKDKVEDDKSLSTTEGNVDVKSSEDKVTDKVSAVSSHPVEDATADKDEPLICLSPGENSLIEAGNDSLLDESVVLVSSEGLDQTVQQDELEEGELVEEEAVPESSVEQTQNPDVSGDSLGPGHPQNSYPILQSPPPSIFARKHKEDTKIKRKRDVSSTSSSSSSSSDSSDEEAEAKLSKKRKKKLKKNKKKSKKKKKKKTADSDSSDEEDAVVTSKKKKEKKKKKKKSD